jgi:hypothetical protein
LLNNSWRKLRIFYDVKMVKFRRLNRLFSFINERLDCVISSHMYLLALLVDRNLIEKSLVHEVLLHHRVKVVGCVVTVYVIHIRHFLHINHNRKLLFDSWTIIASCGISHVNWSTI